MELYVQQCRRLAEGNQLGLAPDDACTLSFFMILEGSSPPTASFQLVDREIELILSLCAADEATVPPPYRAAPPACSTLSEALSSTTIVDTSGLEASTLPELAPDQLESVTPLQLPTPGSLSAISSSVPTSASMGDVGDMLSQMSLNGNATSDPNDPNVNTEDTPPPTATAMYHVSAPSQLRWYIVTVGRQVGVFRGW